MFFSCRLIQTIQLHKKYITAQSFIEILLLGYMIGQNIQAQLFDFTYFYIYFNFIITLFINKLILKSLEDYLSVLFMAHSINETIESQEILVNMIEYHTYYKDHHYLTKSELLKVSIKLRFHIYFYNSYYYLQYIFLFGFIPLLIVNPYEFNIPQFIVISLLLLLNLFDIIESILAITIELPKKIKIFYQQFTLQRKNNQLIYGSECQICMEQLQGSLIQLKCHPSHIFHEICIKLWLNEKDSCPICRNFVNKDNLTVLD